VLREWACPRCGTLGASIRLPSWVDSSAGMAPFPGARRR
jgi:hypothetical protein